MSKKIIAVILVMTMAFAFCAVSAAAAGPISTIVELVRLNSIGDTFKVFASIGLIFSAVRSVITGLFA